MKFSLDSLVGLSSSVQRDLLINRGVSEEDVEVFLNKDRTDVNLQESPYGLINIEKAAEELDKRLSSSKKKVMIVVDSDVDGYTSASIIWLYLSKVYFDAELDFYIHENKEVGIPDGEDYQQFFDYDIIIVPDAGSSQYDKHAELEEKGIFVLVLDHHETEKESTNAIVVNNQLSKGYKNKDLSGAGVTYKFCQVLDDLNGKSYAESLIDLAALGIAADNMDMRNRDNIVIVRRGINLMNDDRDGNLFIKSLIKKKSYSLGDQVYPIDLMFYIAPLINAVVRIGTAEEKDLMFRAFVLGGSKVVGSGRNNKGKMVFVEEEMARISTNVKRHQRKQEMKGMEKISHLIEDDYKDDKIIIIDATNMINRSMTGLVANKIQDKYNRPTLMLLKSDDGFYYGSGRCPSGTELKDFRKYLNNTGLVEYAEGHASAFGIKIKPEAIPELRELSNKLLKDYDFKKVYNVDFLMESNKVDSKYIFKMDEMKHLWGTNLREPLMMINKMEVSKNEIEIIGKARNIIKINNKGVTYIKFRAEDEIAKLKEGNSYSISLIGKPNVNEWAGNVVPQIIMSECEIEAKTKFVF